jgi:hypothetical protein
MSESFNPQDVYELRPPEEFFQGEVRRYADGEWLPDDGEYDVAFIGMANGVEGGTSRTFTYPCCLYYDPPYYKNIIWSWLTTPWRGHIAAHPRGNAWHISLRPGTVEWGESAGRDNHPNYIAGRNGMDKMSAEHSCANGRHAEFRAGNVIIEGGLLRRVSDKAIVTLPDAPNCMYCGLVWRQDKVAAPIAGNS